MNNFNIDSEKLVEFLENKHSSEEWYISSKGCTLVAVPQGQSKDACDKILESLGIKVIEDVPSKFKVTSLSEQGKLIQ